MGLIASLGESKTQHELQEDLKDIVDKNMQKFLRKFITDLEVLFEAIKNKIILLSFTLIPDKDI